MPWQGKSQAGYIKVRSMIGAVDIFFSRIRFKMINNSGWHKNNSEKNMSPDFVHEVSVPVPAFFLDENEEERKYQQEQEKKPEGKPDTI
jgi:hypothetical protein